MNKTRIKKLSFSYKRIRPELINRIYREPKDRLGQYIAAVCLQAPEKELNSLFTHLRAQMAEELAHILCNETQLYQRKKFTIENRTEDSFELFRNGVFLRKFSCWLPTFTTPEIEYKEAVSQEVFQSLLKKHGITEENFNEYWVPPPKPCVLYAIYDKFIETVAV